MTLTYIFHSGFAITGEGYTVIIDYFMDAPDNQNRMIVHDIFLKRPGKIYVLSTHSHHDHFNKEILKWKAIRPDIVYILSNDILKRLKTPKDAAIYLKKLETYQDETIKVQAFGSTDIGGSFLIELDGKRIFHAGDLNNWHWKDESTKEEIERAESDYFTELSLLAESVPELDLAMFPVDIRMVTDYMLGAEQFVDRIPTKVFSPMHFGEDYASAAAFTNYGKKKDVQVIRWSHRGESFEL
ncbi:MAG: MBL fold metallo-hydrolase [Bacteroidota bacterium]|nr:MBL fold metallo-hydrolase [Bacteroidota bacterium]